MKKYLEWQWVCEFDKLSGTLLGFLFTGFGHQSKENSEGKSIG